MTVRIETVNMQEVQAAIRAYGGRAVAEIGKAVQAHAINVRTGIQRRIQSGPKTGAIYDSVFARIDGRVVPVGSRSGNNLSATHQASAPGEAPASDTGALVRSIVYRRVSNLTAEIESTLIYGKWLEEGTRYMEARPSWVPEVEQTRPDFVRRVTEAIARAAR